jgi:hypothetical protein
MPVSTFPILAIIVFLNAHGDIVATATGASDSVADCQKLAFKHLGDDADNPALKGTKPRVYCVDTGDTENQQSKQKLPAGSVQL